MSHVDAIITSDIHLRLNPPECRTDDFVKTQTEEIQFLSALQKKHQCPILDGGDIFNHWKPSPELLSYTIKHLPEGIITIPGNHDLPDNAISQLERSGLWCLAVAEKLHVLAQSSQIMVLEQSNVLVVGLGWGCNLTSETVEEVSAFPGRKVLVTHQMVFKGRKPHWAGRRDKTTRQMLRKYSQFDLIISGHNHSTLIDSSGDRVFVNPGCMSRQRISEKGRIPCLFLWNAEKNKIEKVVWGASQKERVSKQAVAAVRQREIQINRFAAKLSDPEEVSLDFEKNLHAAVQEVPRSVRKFVNQAMETEGA